MKRKHLMINRRNAALLALALATGNVLAVTSGTWAPGGNGDWFTASGWSTNPAIPNGIGDTATITNVGTTSNRSITLLSGNVTVGVLNLQASRNFTVGNASPGGNSLILDNTGSTAAQINVSVDRNYNITAPVQLMDALTITNSMAAGNLSLSFNSVSSNNGSLTISNTSAFHATVTSTRFNGVISDGTAGNSVSLNNLAGLAGISNASNSFSGSTTVTGGVFRIESSTALQSSPLDTAGSIAGDANNGFRFTTGASNVALTALTLGGLTGNKNLASTGGVVTTTSGGYSGVAALTLNPGTGKSYSYSGAIENGAVTGMTLTKTGAGTQVLTGVSGYTGATNVNGGTLSIDGTGSINSSSGVTVNGGTFRYNSSVAYSKPLTFTSGTIAGTNLTGTLDGLTVGSNQTLSPGNSPGTATTGSQTWAGGGSYLLEINNATGTAGADPGWDLENGAGTLDITAAVGTEFNILLTSLTLGNVPGLATNFNDANSYNWLIADFASVTNFSADKFKVTTAGSFSNPFTGSFGVALGGGAMPGDNSQIYLTYSAIPEPGAVVLGGLGLLALLRRRRG